MDAVKTGAYLAALRRAKSKTQQEVADTLHISNKTISKWEQGSGWPEITVLPALAELYGVTADEILAGEAGAAASEPGKSGASQVERYLERRGELPFRLGLGAAALCVLGGILYRRSYFIDGLMALLGSSFVLWIGWQWGGGAARRHLLPLMALAAGQLWLALGTVCDWANLAHRIFPWPSYQTLAHLQFWIQPQLTWWLFLALLPLLYGGLRALLRHQTPGAALLPRSAFWTLTAIWGGEVCIALWRLAVMAPLMAAYAAATVSKRTEAVVAVLEALKPFQWAAGVIPAIAVGVAFLAGLRRRKKAVAESGGK